MPNAITTLDQVKEACHIVSTNTNWDDVLGDWITAVGDAFQIKYHQLLNAQNLLETHYDVTSNELLALRSAPVNSLGDITVYDTDDAYPNGLVLTPASDYRLHDQTTGIIKFYKLSAFIPVGMMEVMALVPVTWGRVDIAYNAGFKATIPAGIQRGAAELIAHWWDQYGGNQELKTKEVGRIRQDFYDFTKWPLPVLQAFAPYDTAAVGMVGVI